MPAFAETRLPIAESAHRSCQTPAPPNELLLLAESQWLFTETELLRTPSILDGLSPDKERENRGKGVNFILQVGIMLKLPQITLATASVYLHRFFMRHSMFDLPTRPGFHYYSMAATSLFLATKVEENCRKMKELVVACVRVAQKEPNKAVDEQDREFWRWKDNILHNEDLLLEAICFDLSLEPPYTTLFELLVHFGEENNKRLRNAAWAFVNDSCLTMLCLLFPSRTIAASALYAAAKHCNVSFPDDEHGRAWWDVVGVDLNRIRKACNFMASVYENTPLRGGRDGGIYERTPEDGDEGDAKTRDRTERSDDFTGKDGSDSGLSPGLVSGRDRRPAKRGREAEESEQQVFSTNGTKAKPNGTIHLPHLSGFGQGELSNADNGKRQRLNSDDANDTAKLQGDLDKGHDQQKNDDIHNDLTVENLSEEGEVEP